MVRAKKDEMNDDQREPDDFGLDDIDGEPEVDTDEMDNLRIERDDMRDRFMRALADAENARKRGDRDRREAEQYGGSKLAGDSATEDQRAASPALIEGVDLTLRELTKVLTKHGVEPISPKVGDLFDPKHHEAMFEAPLPGTKVGQIIQVMTEGFMLHDRLLRPASVGVSSNTQG